MIHISHGNYVRYELMAALLTPGSSPVKRIRKRAEESGNLIDATSGNKTRSVIILSTGQVVLSSLTTNSLKERIEEVFRRAKLSVDEQQF